MTYEDSRSRWMADGEEREREDVRREVQADKVGHATHLLINRSCGSG
jgi:hypothetical protein